MTEYSEYAYENYSADEIVAAENYRDQVREWGGANHHPDAHTIATRARNHANAAQVAEWNAEAESVARIEKILGDTRHRRGNPNPVYFLDAGDLCWMGK